MRAPTFLKDRFAPDTAASVWFRSNTGQGAMRGRVTRWEEQDESQTSYLVFELVAGGVLYLPFSDIYLSTLSAVRYEEAKLDSGLEDRMRAVAREQSETQLRQHESGLASPH